MFHFFTIVDEEQEGLGEDDEEHHQDVGEDRHVAEGREVHQGGEGQLDHDPEDLADGGHDLDASEDVAILSNHPITIKAFTIKITTIT